MGTEKKFLTYQTVQRYEAALLRHAQFCRWTRVVICPCLTTGTNQPDINCPICKGRGEIYKSPGPFRIIDEPVGHDHLGRVHLKNDNFILSSVVLWRTGAGGVQAPLTLDVNQPSDGSYVQLAYPWPHSYERLYANYLFSNDATILSENCVVILDNVLLATSCVVPFKGRNYYGSISSVSRVYNKTKDITYTVKSFAKQFISLTSMTSYTAGDVLEVDYTYQKPYPFLVHSVSTKLRYEAAYIIDQADAVVQTAYYYDVKPNDLITPLAMEIPGYSIIDPTVNGPSANDIITDVYDIARFVGITDAVGKEYSVFTDVALVGRNEIKWLTAKPTVRYNIQFMYTPTFVGLTTYDTSRYSENKAFVNRINVMVRDRMTSEVTF